MKYALRALWSSRGFTAVVVTTLSLGIGANTAIFSLLDAVMLRPLPVQDPEQLVLLTWKSEQPAQTMMHYGWTGCPEHESVSGGCSFSYPFYKRLREQQDVFVAVFAFAGPGSITTSTSINSQTDRIPATFVSGNFFSTLRVQTAAGRPLEDSDDRPDAEPSVVIGNGLWRREFGADRSVIGSTIRLQGISFTVVGVAPTWFQGVHPGVSRDLWLPLSSQPRLLEHWPKLSQENAFWVQVVARLRKGVTAEKAESEVNVIFSRNSRGNGHQVFPVSANPRIYLRNASLGLDTMRSEFRTPLIVLMAVVTVILLISCANIAVLMLVRSLNRQRDTAIRMAIGTPTRAIFLQSLMEGLLITVGGAALGIVLAYWISTGMAGFLSTNVHLQVNTQPNLRVLLFTLSVSVLTGLGFSAAPGLASRRTDVISALKLGGTSSGNANGSNFHDRIGRILVVGQVALSFVALAGAGLLVRTLIKLETVKLGFNPRNVLLFNVAAGNSYKGRALANLYQELQTRFSSLPGVTSVSYSNLHLLSGSRMPDIFTIRPEEESTLQANVLSVGPAFFETMGIPLLAGRTFTPSDSRSYRESQNVVVNSAFARLFGSASPIGKHFVETVRKMDCQIVGIVGDAKYDDVRSDVEPAVYFSFQEYGGAFAIRTKGDPRALIPSVRDTVHEVDRNIPLFDVQTLTDEVQKGLYRERLVATLSSLVAMLALGLASLGLYGLLSYDAVCRTREIGTRMALGARRQHILRFVMQRGLGLAISGAIIGIACAAGLARFLRSMLYGVKPTDPETFIGITLLFLLVATVACHIPARRASNLEPLEALKCE